MRHSMLIIMFTLIPNLTVGFFPLSGDNELIPVWCQKTTCTIIYNTVYNKQARAMNLQTSHTFRCEVTLRDVLNTFPRRLRVIANRCAGCRVLAELWWHHSIASSSRPAPHLSWCHSKDSRSWIGSSVNGEPINSSCLRGHDLRLPRYAKVKIWTRSARWAHKTQKHTLRKKSSRMLRIKMTEFGIKAQLIVWC